ncbi:MAG: DMT family transporter [Pseudomonadota bacterium]
MTTTVFVAVIFAALLHAVWNALVKGGADKFRAMLGVNLGYLPIAALILPFAPAPSAESFLWLAGGAVLRFGYQLFLVAGYRIGDLTQVYPIARGSAPLIVAGVSVGALGVALSGLELLAIGLIVAGILSISLVRREDGARNARAVLMALATGGFIAAYSLVDGLGARAAGTALGYWSWSAIGSAVLFAAWTAAVRPGMLTDFARDRRAMLSGLAGGTASFLAYALVVWSFTQAPIAVVTALRETSIIFALLIGVVFLRERLNLVKVASTFVTIVGAALLRLARP